MTQPVTKGTILEDEFVSARLCDVIMRVFQTSTELEEQGLRQLTGQIANRLRETAGDIEAYGKSSPSERAEMEKCMSLEMARAPDGKDFIRSKACAGAPETEGRRR
jgi:hypothetical protein